MRRRTILSLAIPLAVAAAGCTSTLPTTSSSSSTDSTAQEATEVRLGSVTARLVMPEGWVQGTRYRDMVFLDGPDGVAAAIGTVDSVVPYPVPDDPGSIEPLDPPRVETVIDYLEAHPALNVTDPEPIEVGELSGQRVDLTADERVPIIIPSRGPAGAEEESLIAIESVGIDRLVLLQQEDPEQVLFVDVYTDNRNAVDEAWTAAQPVLEGLTFK